MNSVSAHAIKPLPNIPPIKGVFNVLRMINSLQNDMIGYFEQHQRQFPDIYGLTLGGETQYIVTNPDLIHAILVTHNDKFYKGRDYTDRQRGLALFLGNGLLTSDGEFWKRQRKLVAPALHAKRIEAYAATMVSAAARTADSWHGQTQLDIDHAMTHVTLEIVGKTLFNVEVGADADRIGGAMTILQTALMPADLLPRWIPTPQRIRIKRAIRTLDEIVYRIIAERRASNEDHGDLLSMLMLARDDDGGAMSDEQIRDEAVTLFLAGHETTANALNWTWVLLAQNPQVEARLHEELDHVLGGRLPTLDDLKRLPYTELVIKEAMRLYPPAYTFGRAAREDVQIGDYLLPAGSMLTIFNYFTQRDARFWDAPDEFRPERFSEENEAQHHKYAYVPFGGGPRVCIGNSFAMMEARLLLATIAQRYTLRLAPNYKIALDPLITLRPKGGLPMLIAERTPVKVMA